MPQFRPRKILQDLTKLVDLLKKYDFENNNIIELYQLQNLIGQAKKDESVYNYNIDNLVFNISASGMKPYPNVTKLTVVIKLDYILNSNLSVEVDAFNTYSLELFIKGFEDTTSIEEYKFFCWHLDKEVNIDGKFIHPLYHFHAGGKRIKDIEKGNLIFISSPRIPHPQMDIILAIHFVIQNFINGKEITQKTKLLADDNYIDLIGRAQMRVLDPYFQSIAGARHSLFTKQNLFPLYL